MRPYLPIPQVSADVPSYYALSWNSGNTIGIAEGLLKAGILKEEHWTGDIGSTVRTGLNHWLNFEMGLADCRFLNDMTFFYTDDLSHDSLEEQSQNYYIDSTTLHHALKIERVNGQPTSTVGGFGFVVDSWDEVHIGQGIEHLEEIVPGAGYAVLSVIHEALNNTVDSGNPIWGRDLLKWFGTWEPSAHERLPAGYMTYVNRYGEAPLDKTLYLAHIPERATIWKKRRAFLRHVLSRCADPDVRETIHQAVELGAFLTRAYQARALVNHRYYNHIDAWIPILLRWSEEDSLLRLWDDYHEHLGETGESTGIAFLSAFAMNRLDRRGEGSLPWAITNLRNGVEVIKRVDTLIGRIAPDDQRRRGNTLMQIFAQEEIDRQDPYYQQALLEEQRERRAIREEEEEEYE